MAQYTIIYWRDIPTQINVKKGREVAKRHLGERFEKAVDRAAMHAKLRDSDAYLGEMRRSDPVECSDDIEAEATALFEKLNAEYDEARLKALVMAGGKLDGAAGE